MAHSRSSRRFLFPVSFGGAVNLLFVLLYASLLHWAYLALIVPEFSYLGYVHVDRDFSDLVVAYLFVALPLTFLPFRIDRPSRLVASLLYLFVYIPSLIVTVLANDRPVSQLLLLFLSLLIGLLILALSGRITPLNVPSPKISPLLWWFLLMMVGIGTFGFLISQFGLRTPPSPLDPYDVRLEARLFGAPTGYALRLAGNVIGPLIMTYALLSAQWHLFLLGTAVQILVYSFDGTKSTLLAPALLLGLRLLLLRGNINFGKLVIVLTGFVSVVVALDSLLDLPFLSSLFLRRLIITPGLLTGVYFDFFSANEPFWWSHSFLRWFMENPHQISPAFLIGKLYFGSEATSANANIWADGIANLGLIGPVVVSLVAAAFLWFVDALSKGKGPFAMLGVAIPTFAFVNSAFFTSLFTHGFLWALIFIWLVPRRFYGRA